MLREGLKFPLICNIVVAVSHLSARLQSVRPHDGPRQPTQEEDEEAAQRQQVTPSHQHHACHKLFIKDRDLRRLHWIRVTSCLAIFEDLKTTVKYNIRTLIITQSEQSFSVTIMNIDLPSTLNTSPSSNASTPGAGFGFLLHIFHNVQLSGCGADLEPGFQCSLAGRGCETRNPGPSGRVFQFSI